MCSPKFVKAMATLALLTGVLHLSMTPVVIASEREEEAKKYTEQLRKGKDAKSKIQALQQLGTLAQIKKSLVAEALPDIYKALEDKDPGVRAAAGEALGKADEPADKAVPLLVKILKDDKDVGAKIGAMKGLSAMGSNAKSAAPTLRQLLKESDKKSKIFKSAQITLKAISGKN
ncbi:MAG: HEAT repeat domain-containing protein [Planctomycetia bacterium]|nr:HEAT repeat domain-containing protein [Planctomycetia bacterium]